MDDGSFGTNYPDIYARWRCLDRDDPLKWLMDMSVVKLKAILDLFQLLVRQWRNQKFASPMLDRGFL